MATTCVKDGTIEDFKSSRGDGPELQDPRNDPQVMAEFLAKKAEEMKDLKPFANNPELAKRLEEIRSEDPNLIPGVPEGMMPNPAFQPTMIGGQLRFSDDQGNPHEHAADAAAANVNFEKNIGGLTPTGGNCDQVPALAPDFVPDPSYQKK